MKPDFKGETWIPGVTPKRIEEDHIERYRFASRFIKGKIVLDIACGAGYGSKYLLSHGAKEVVGVDISDEAIKYARQHYVDDKLIFMKADATNLGFINETFDVVVSFETIEHVEKYHKFLEEINRVLKTDGILLLSSPNRLVTSSDYPKRKKRPDNPFHFAEFTEVELIDLLKNNFKEVKVLGQRMVNKMFILPFIRRVFFRLGDVFISKIYMETDNSLVKQIPFLKCPRYFIIICRKNE